MICHVYGTLFEKLRNLPQICNCVEQIIITGEFYCLAASSKINVFRLVCQNRHGSQHGLFNCFSFSELNKNPVEGFSAGLIDDNDIYRWEVLIIGPPDTL